MLSFFFRYDLITSKHVAFTVNRHKDLWVLRIKLHLSAHAANQYVNRTIIWRIHSVADHIQNTLAA